MNDLEKFAEAFLEFSNVVDHYPSIKIINKGASMKVIRDDLPLAERVDLLFNIAFECEEPGFLEAAIALMDSGRLSVIPDDDAKSGIELHRKIRTYLDEDSPFYGRFYSELIFYVERMIAAAIEGGLNTEDLVSVIELLQECLGEDTPKVVEEAINQSIDYELYQTHDAIRDLESEDELSQQLELLDTIEVLTGHDASHARAIVGDKLYEYEQRDYGEREVSGLRSGPKSQGEPFDDNALNSLFAALVQK